MYSTPEPSLTPEYPEPVSECAYCQEEIYRPNEVINQGDILVIDGCDVHDNEECIKGYMQEHYNAEMISDNILRNGYTMTDYVKDYLVDYRETERRWG